MVGFASKPLSGLLGMEVRLEFYRWAFCVDDLS